MKKLITLLALGIYLMSCSSDFLELSPQHNSNEKNFFQTEDHFTQAANGAYEGLRGMYGVYQAIVTEMRSDNTHYIRYEADRAQRQYEEVADFIDDSQNLVSDDTYINGYAAISRVNTILDRIGDKPFSDDFKNSIIGQMKFLRAFYYFHLVRCYGDLCLYLHEVKVPEESFLPRSPVEQVYEQIIDDVNDAINRLPVVSFPQDGRATKGSARMLLAYVLMTKPQKDYPGAETQLREIMTMGYELLPNYADIYEPSKKNHKESIFEVQYQQGDQGQNSNWLYYFIPRTAEAEIITGVSGSNTIADAGWNIPTQEMVDSYEEGDLRVGPSIAVIAGHNDEYGRFVYDEVLNVGDPKIAEYPISYYFINKYNHPHAKIRNTDDNWPVYRYADVLLLLAECLVEQGRAAEAAPYINQVRQRAGLPALKTVDAQAVADERRHELAFESHRWFDLLRTGKAIEVMTAHGKRMKALHTYLPERTYQITKERLLYPIPYRELQINSLLTQNPGYN